MTFKNLKHINIVTLLSVQFLFSAASLVPVPSIKNFAALKYFSLSEKLSPCRK